MTDTDPVLSTAEREAFDRFAREKWGDDPAYADTERYLSAAALLAARDFYGPKRVAELEQERDGALKNEQGIARLWQELRCAACNGTGQIGHDAGASGSPMYEDCTACDGSGVSDEALRNAEQRERILRETLAELVRVKDNRPRSEVQGDRRSMMDYHQEKASAWEKARAALAVSPEQTEGE